MGTFRGKRKENFIYTKDGQDYGPMSLKELEASALEGEVSRDTPVRTVRGDWKGVAGEIPRVAARIEEYEEKERIRREKEQIEREVRHIEKEHKRKAWIPYLLIALAFGGLGAGYYFILVMNRKVRKFDSTVIFREIDLPKLTPMEAGATVPRVQRRPISHHRKTKGGIGRILHSWTGTATIEIDLTEDGNKRPAQALNLMTIKRKLERVLGACATSEHRARRDFKDAQCSFLLRKGNSPSLTAVRSDSGVSQRFIRCLRRGLRSIHIPRYEGNQKILTIPIIIE